MFAQNKYHKKFDIHSLFMKIIKYYANKLNILVAYEKM